MKVHGSNLSLVGYMAMVLFIGHIYDVIYQIVWLLSTKAAFIVTCLKYCLAN
jgi:hypothetical protein